jgi:hypothetical protein
MASVLSDVTGEQGRTDDETLKAPPTPLLGRRFPYSQWSNGAQLCVPPDTRTATIAWSPFD